MEVLHQFGTDEQKQTVADAAARRRDPLGVRHDRARRRQLRRDQHRAAHRARRRRLRAQRAQVVDHERLPPQLQDHDRDGQDAARRADVHTAEPDPRAAGHARRDGGAQPARVRLRRPGRARRSRLQGRARARLQPHRQGGRRLHDRPGAPRPGPHPPLHARDRRRRARARGDVQARGLARHVRQAARHARQRARTGSPSRASRSRWRACSR